MTTTEELRLKYREARQARNDSQDNESFDQYHEEMERIIQLLEKGIA